MTLTQLNNLTQFESYSWGYQIHRADKLIFTRFKCGPRLGIRLEASLYQFKSVTILGFNTAIKWVYNILS